MLEVLFIIVMVGGLLIPSAVFAFWWLFWAMLTFSIVFGCYEGIAKAISGLTISQQFWKLSGAAPWKAWIILISFEISFLALGLHLGWKLITKGR